ncbi:hypothetical protein M0R45_035232 [Rubus argutus]|uniref:Pentatricopeptide repeat-containing protein n=1 Tax=Rubus argutus TaxID=59490 RepID=A0AAW1VU85_RUBAR
MYFKFGKFGIAQKLFNEMRARDVVSWNTLVAGYCVSGQVGKARRVLGGMLVTSEDFVFLVDYDQCVCQGRMGNMLRLLSCLGKCKNVGALAPNDVTLFRVLSACAHLGALDL